MSRMLVWDLPVRLVHWTLAACVLVAYLTAEGEGTTHQVHVAAGYAIGVLILFRLIWGVLGSRHARFDDFARSLRRLPGYLPRLLQLRPPRFVGHNPLGVLMILAMIGVLAGTLWTGLYGGEELHETFGNLIVILAGIHVLGVLADSVLTGDNLIAAMITGRKPRQADDARAEPGRTVPWRAGAAALVTALVAWGGFQQSEALTWPPPTEGELEEAERGEGEHEADDEHEAEDEHEADEAYE